MADKFYSPSDFTNGFNLDEPQVSEEPVVSSYSDNSKSEEKFYSPSDFMNSPPEVTQEKDPVINPSVSEPANYDAGQPSFSWGATGDAINEVADTTSKAFKGSGIPTAIAGTTYAYYAGTEGLYSTLGYEEGAKVAEDRKNFWDKKRGEYKVKELEGDLLDNPMLGLNPMYWNYQLGKMAPGVAATALTGGTGMIPSLVGGTTLSMEGAADKFKEVYANTGDKFAAAGAATTSLFTNTLLEAAGLDTIIKPVGKLLTRSAKGFAGEGGTEATQNFTDEIQQILWEKTSQGYSMADIAEYTLPKLGGILKRSLSAGITGGVLGGGIAGSTGSRGEVPSSREQAEAILAEQGAIEQWEVGAPQEIRDAVKKLESMPPVELAPKTADGSLRYTTIPPLDEVKNVEPSTNLDNIPEVTQAQDVLTETPLQLERNAVPEATNEQAPSGNIQEPGQEQGIQQPTEAPSTIPGTSQENVQQADPSVIAGEGATEVAQAPLVMEPSAELPTTERLVTPGEEVAQQETEFAKQRMGAGEQTPGQPQGEINFTEAQKEHLAQTEPIVYQQISDYFGKDINKPLTGLVKLIQEGGIAEDVRAKVESITGKPVKSLVDGATKVGHTTFKNIAYDVVKEKRMDLLGITKEEGIKGLGSLSTGSTPISLSSGETTGTQETTNSTLDNTNSIPLSITGRTSNISTRDTTLEPQVSDNLTEEQKTLLSLPPKEPEIQGQEGPLSNAMFKFELARVPQKVQDVFQKLKSGSLSGPQLVAASRVLGVSRGVVNKLAEQFPDTPKNAVSLFAKAGDKKVKSAIESVMREKFKGKVNQERSGLVQPSVAVQNLEEALTTPTKEKPTKANEGPKERTPEEQAAFDESVEELRKETQDFAEAQSEQSVKESVKEKYGYTTDKLVKWARRSVINGIETLGDISPSLKGIMKRFEARVLDQTKQRQDQAKPFKTAYREMSKIDKQLMGKILNNRSSNRHSQLLKDYIDAHPDFAQALAQVDQVLIGIQNDQVANGQLKEVIRNYFPRRVKDLDGLMDYLADQNNDPNAVINEIRKITGNKDIDEVQATQLFQKMLERGENPALLLSPGSKKSRTIWEVTNEMQKFYYNPLEALDAHIREATESIEQRRVIGSSRIKKNRLKLAALEEKGANLTKSEMAEKLMLTQALADTTVVEDGDLTDWFRNTVLLNKLPMKDQRLALEVFKARFNQKPTGRFLSALKDISMVSALGQIGSTVTQAGDIAPLIRQYGLGETLKAIASDKIMTKADADLHAFNKDLGKSTVTSDILEKVLKATQFERVDSFFASTNMELARQKALKQSFEEFSKQWSNVFKPAELTQLYQDIKDGNKKSELFREFSFIELSETRPLFPTDMPVTYMHGGNWRILYALKSWNLKTLNNIRRDIIAAKREGGNFGAAKTALSYVILLTAGGMGTDLIKDLIAGDEPDIPESIGDNLLKLVMMNRYNLGKIEKEGFGGYIADMFKPPTGFLDKPFEDVMAAFDPDSESKYKTLQEIPVFGKVLWQRMSGGGGEKRKLDADRKRAYGFLKDAITDKDPDSMKEFHRRKNEYNAKIKGKEGFKRISYESIQRARQRYLKELREKDK